MWPFEKKKASVWAPNEPSAALIAEAKENPNGWVYVIDGEFGPDEHVPPDRIIGGWKVGPTGELTGEYHANPNYRGSAP